MLLLLCCYLGREGTGETDGEEEKQRKMILVEWVVRASERRGCNGKMAEEVEELEFI